MPAADSTQRAETRVAAFEPTPRLVTGASLKEDFAFAFFSGTWYRVPRLSRLLLVPGTALFWFSTPHPCLRSRYFLVVSVLGIGTTEGGCPDLPVESVASLTFAASSST